jgi:N utilization substance protein B
VDKEDIKKRRRARKMALQALYQWLMSGGELSDIQAQFCAMETIEKVDVAYFSRLLYGVVRQLPELETAFSPLLDRPANELNPIEHTVLRLSAFELLFVPEIPYRVVLDESVALAREFGSQDGHRYVNGVLNNLAKTVRSVEIDAWGRDA